LFAERVEVAQRAFTTALTKVEGASPQKEEMGCGERKKKQGAQIVDGKMPQERGTGSRQRQERFQF
jgi:hypothetical protein